MECDRSKTIVFDAFSERECSFHESERKAKAGKGYFDKVSTYVDIEDAGGSTMRTRPHTRS